MEVGNSDVFIASADRPLFASPEIVSDEIACWGKTFTMLRINSKYNQSSSAVTGSVWRGRGEGVMTLLRRIFFSHSTQECSTPFGTALQFRHQLRPRLCTTRSTAYQGKNLTHKNWIRSAARLAQPCTTANPLSKMIFARLLPSPHRFQQLGIMLAKTISFSFLLSDSSVCLCVC